MPVGFVATTLDWAAAQVNTGSVRALSFTQPWLWIMCNLGKNIENRTRNLGNYRGTLLMHAAKGMSAEDWWFAYNFVRERIGADAAARIPSPFPPSFFHGDGSRAVFHTVTCLQCPALVRGAVVGVCEVVNQIRPGGAWVDGLFPAAPDMRWYMGEHAYLLDNVRELTAPIPCKGALGFWKPPASVLTQICGGPRS